MSGKLKVVKKMLNGKKKDPIKHALHEMTEKSEKDDYSKLKKKKR